MLSVGGFLLLFDCLHRFPFATAPLQFRIGALLCATHARIYDAQTGNFRIQLHHICDGWGREEGMGKAL